MTQPFIGEIRIFAFDFPPIGWAFCAGQSVDITTNGGLFALIGTTYGGDGVNTFNLPNLQGRVALHQGTGPGLSTRVLGEQGGTESVTLTANQMPVHSHRVNAATTSDGASPANKVYGSSSDDLYGDPVATNEKAAASGPMAVGALGTTGSGQAHENRHPGLVMNISIALEGIFPSRN